MNKKKTWIR